MCEMDVKKKKTTNQLRRLRDFISARRQGEGPVSKVDDAEKHG